MRSFMMMVLAMLAVIAPTSANAQSVPSATPADLELYFDGIIPYALEQAGIPGAAVSVVKDDRIVFAKGYGVADLKAGRRVTPDATLFRIGSISKLLTWTAVMQLVEQGKLDLDRDINTYLDFRIPDTYPGKITLRLLMTHRAGFEEVSRGMTQYGAGPGSLGNYLRNHIPKRIFAPGDRIAYSNYGAALAGYIVERVSGETYPAYIERHILTPLGMTRTSVVQPPRGALAAMAARSYASLAEPEPTPYATVSAAPAGAIASTATDMAHFLIAHLQGGRFGNAAILRPESIAEMHRVQYRAAPGRNGFALGFWEANRNGYRLVGHSGDWTDFHSILYFAPESGYGIFVTLNGTGTLGRKLGSDTVRNAVALGFFDRFVPGRVADEPTVESRFFDATRVAGFYRSTRRNESGPQLMRLFEGDDEVAAAADGTITVSSRLAADGAPKSWRQVGPLTYREVGGQAHLSFVAGKDGKILYWVSDDYPPAMVFERVKGIFGTGLVQPLFWLALLTSAAFAVTAPIVWWRRRKRHEQSEPSWIASRVGLGWIALVMSGWIGAAVLGGLGDDLGILNVLRGASMIAVLVVLFPALHAGLTIKRSKRKVQWVVETMGALLALYAAWFMVSQNLASFNNSF
ncbi:MAG: serine hydrolase [Candidatus Sphingomonas phytovorans]|nr:serine hydrolase [Sphingomonas sp.]WEK01205.1 MAG: serine hydrolase [Sphingomonas sp.]